MTTVAPPGSGPVPPSQGDSIPSSSPLSWEGDKMFNIYIYDYCYKRGFRKTAHELLTEAEIPPESTPPINARQGLLFEWWSVFWVLFTAKANGNGTDEAMLYTQHQAQQAQRQAAQRLQQQPQPPLGQSQPPMQHQQPPMRQLINGMPTRQPSFISNGQLPNGVGSAALQQGPMQPGGPTSFPMGGPGPQPNGIPGPSGPPPVPGAQPQNFPQLLPGQRPPLGGQRGPNGPPFQSPTMAHSPQHSGATPGQQQQQHSQAPMSQLGPSPHLAHMNRGGMPPPNGPQGMSNPGQQVPSPSFQQLGRPPSRTATPGQGGMMTHPSPSMAARQPPGGMMPGNDQRQAQEASIITNEFMRIPPHLLASLKQEAGLMDKDQNSYVLDEKHRIVSLYRQRLRNGKPGSQGVNNATAGPSNPTMQPPNLQRNPSQQQQRGNKRNSTSPAQDQDNLPRNESSPPERKRVRRSPMGMEQPPPTPTTYPHPPQQQQGGPGGQQQQQAQQIGNGMMRGPMGGPMNGFPHQPGMPQMGNPMNMGMGQVMGVSQMGNAMSPAMSHPSAGMMNSQQMQHMQVREAQYRQSLHAKGGIPGGGNAGSPSSDPSFNSSGPPGQGPGQGGGPQFNPGVGPNNRMGQNKPMSMMPPPSPAVNGPPKDQNGPNKDKNSKNSSNGHPEGSPRNPPNSGQTPNTGGTAPPTPAPGGANQNQNQTNQIQNQNPGQNMAPSPSSILGGNPMNPASSLGQQPPPSASSAPDMLFPTDFIHSVASSLDEFDTSIFRPDGDINFERDFGQWFNPDDVGVLEMK